MTFDILNPWMEKNEIYKKILDILEKKINQNDYKIQQNVLIGGSNQAQLKMSKLINGIGDCVDIKDIANESFNRISITSLNNY